MASVAARPAAAEAPPNRDGTAPAAAAALPVAELSAAAKAVVISATALFHETEEELGNTAAARHVADGPRGSATAKAEPVEPAAEAGAMPSPLIMKSRDTPVSTPADNAAATSAANSSSSSKPTSAQKRRSPDKPSVGFFCACDTFYSCAPAPRPGRTRTEAADHCQQWSQQGRHIVGGGQRSLPHYVRTVWSARAPVVLPARRQKAAQTQAGPPQTRQLPVPVQPRGPSLVRPRALFLLHHRAV